MEHSDRVVIKMVYVIKFSFQDAVGYFLIVTDPVKNK